MEYNLAQSIERIVIGGKSPMTPAEIVDKIKQLELLEKDAANSLTITHVNTTVSKSYNSLQDINGRIITIEDNRWKELLSSLWYIESILRNDLHRSELDFAIPALFYFKRIYDINDVSNESQLSESHSFLLEKIPLFSNLDYNSFIDILPILDKGLHLPVGIFNGLLDYLNKVRGGNAIEAFNVLMTIDTRPFSREEYGAFFEYLIGHVSRNKNRHDVIRTPSQIIELMAGILNAKRGSLYDPVCGVGGLLTEVVKKSEQVLSIKATELNYKVAQLAFMNLSIYYSGFFKLSVGNCFEELHNHETYDHIIADLPASGIASYLDIDYMSNEWGLTLPKNRKGFGAIVLFVLSKLSANGKAVLTVSENFLSSGGTDEKIREFLLKKDFIECIISLPAGSLRPYTNGSACIMVLNKIKPKYLIDKIKFIQVESASIEGDIPYFNPLEIVDLYRLSGESNGTVQIIDNKYLTADSVLDPNKYTNGFNETIQLLSEGKAVLLGDLVNIKSGTAIPKLEGEEVPQGIPYVKIENLEKDILDIRLDSNKLLNKIELHKSNMHFIVKSDALLIARLGENIKPTYFKPSEGLPEILIHSNVYVLEPTNRYELNLEYLYYQLYSLYVQKQIDQRKSGSAMPFLNRKNLRDVAIPYMSLSAQKAFVDSQKSSIIAAERERVNQRIKAIGFEEEGILIESEIVRTLVHELRPQLSKIHSFAKKISRIIAKHNIKGLQEYKEVFTNSNDSIIEDLLEKNENYSLEEAAEILLADTIQLSDTLSAVKDIMTFNIKPNEFVEIDLYDFIQDFFINKSRELQTRYVFNVRGEHVSVAIHKESFKSLLDQLLVNAEKHGFTKPEVTYKLQFSIKKDSQRNVVVIEYSNNGEAFALQHKDYIGAFIKSKKSDGSGIGGNFIYRIIKAHKGNMLVKDRQNRGFSITFEIPINPKTNE